MFTGALLLLCSGPLLVAATLITLTGSYLGDMHGAVIAGGVLVALQLSAALGVCALYKWCFVRPATRSASLLASLIVSVYVLSDPTLLPLLVKALLSNTYSLNMREVLITVSVEGLFLVGVAVVSCMLGVLLFELPIRWFQGDRQLVYDGLGRALRGIGVIALLLIGSSLFRTEGAFRLVDIIRRALA